MMPLLNGRQATLIHATPPLPASEGAKLGWFLEQIWGGYDKPDVFVTATAKGMFETDSCNDFVWAEVDGEIVGTVWTITGRDTAAVGALGEVYTTPEMRGQGLAQTVCSAILAVFDGRGGQCMFLATNNPAAARVYERLGFEHYREFLMRRLTPHDGNFEEHWFAPGDVSFREMVWGDIPRLAALYSARNAWVSVCYPQGLFSSSYVQHVRCTSFTKHTWQNTRLGLWLGMFNRQGALVGSCPVYPRGNEREIIGGEIDLFVHPNFVAQAGELLNQTRQVLRGRGWRWWMAQLPAQDSIKQNILEQRGGFREIASLPEALSIDGRRQDVHILRADL